MPGRKVIRCMHAFSAKVRARGVCGAGPIPGERRLEILTVRDEATVGEDIIGRETWPVEAAGAGAVQKKGRAWARHMNIT